MPGNAFVKLFSQSPIRPLQQHMSKVQQCAEQLTDFFASACANDWDKAKSVYQIIRDLEHEADEYKKNIRLNLPKSLFMPINRNDLLILLSRQDQVANCAKDIAGTMLGRKMRIPETIRPLLEPYVAASLETVSEAHTIVHELDELVETGFGGREIEWIENLITKLEEFESKSDGYQIEIRSALHKIENDMSPIDVMFLYKIFELIGNLADMAEKVGDQIHVIVAR